MSVSSEDQLRSKYKSLFLLVDDAASPVCYYPRFREFGIARMNPPGQVSNDVFDMIEFCPVTGHKLPPSLRDQYFDEIEELGFYASDDEGLPEKYRSSRWWSSTNN